MIVDSVGHGRREGPPAEPIEILAAAVDRQDGGLVEGAAQVRLIGVAEVVFEVEVRLRVGEVVAELVVRITVRRDRADVVVGLDDEIDARAREIRLTGDGSKHLREHFVEVGERRHRIEAERLLHHRR